MKNHMRRILVLKLCFILILLNLTILSRSDIAEAAVETKEPATKEIIVKYKEGYLPTYKKRVATLSLHKDIKLGLERVLVPVNTDINKVIEVYRQDPNVEYIHPNYKYKVSSVPSDPFYPDQWYLNNIKAEAAWDITTGKDNIIVAVLDTGVDLTHPELENNLTKGVNFLKEGLPSDDNGHGTHVAGIIAGAMNNNQGITGIAPQIKIMPIKVMASNGLGDDYTIARGIRYAVENGAKVLNLSFGTYEYSKTMEDAINYAYEKGVLIVAAAGNDGQGKVSYPAKFTNVIAVSATDQTDKLAYFSNYGAEIELSAPGEKILSAWPYDNKYMYMDGTSAATPVVSAVAALIWSKNSEFYNFQIRETLRNYADDLGTQGWDNQFGYGKVNAFNAVKIALPKTFKDIQGHWAQGDIESLATTGVVKGYGSIDYFAPQEKVTRAEFSTMLVRALGLEQYQGAEIQFTDVPAVWYTGYVKAAAKAGIVKGYNDGSFGPSNNITRQEMAAMIMRSMRLQGQISALQEEEQEVILGQFSDNATVSLWARAELAEAIKSNIVRGVTSTALAPMNDSNRAEAATVITRMLGREYN